MLIAALSDTHVGDGCSSLSNEVLETLQRRQPKLIVHAGDIVAPRVLHDLKAIAETVAVKGDNDSKEFPGGSLPDYWSERMMGHTVIVAHGDREHEREAPSRTFNIMMARLHLPFRWWNGFYRDLYNHFSHLNPSLIISGHLHQASRRLYNHTLIVNPGAVYQNGRGMQSHAVSSMAFLHIRPQSLQVELVRLHMPETDLFALPKRIPSFSVRPA